MKPREWWIANVANGKNISGKVDLFTAVNERPQNSPWTHVIEKSAYDALMAEAMKLRRECNFGHSNAGFAHTLREFDKFIAGLE